MKNILKNLALIVFTAAASLVIAEVALRMEGRYHDLASQVLVPSLAIWDRPANQIDFGRHPDLTVPIEVRFDRDGVRNHSEPSTRDKQNIIGFFGDSFIENRRIEDRFSFTSILDVAAQPHARVVSYGVDAYGLDQSYLRYKKYEKHAIHDVVYVFCENDLENLYETGLTEMTQNGDISFNVPSIDPFYQFIGRFHVTYLAVSAYYKVRTLVELVRAGKWEWISIGPADLREGYPERFHDQYADAITTDFLSLDHSASTLRLSKKFLALLQKWNREDEASQRTFTVLVLPWKIEDEVATKLFQNFDGNVVHSLGILENCKKCTFKSDGHWNEYGNAKMAEFILSNGRFPFQGKFRMTNISGLKIEIDEYYNRLQP